MGISAYFARKGGRRGRLRYKFRQHRKRAQLTRWSNERANTWMNGRGKGGRKEEGKEGWRGGRKEEGWKVER